MRNLEDKIGLFIKAPVPLEKRQFLNQIIDMVINLKIRNKNCSEYEIIKKSIIINYFEAFFINGNMNEIEKAKEVICEITGF